MKRPEVVSHTARHVRHTLYDEASGHDWWHVERVRRVAVGLAKLESADVYIVELAALLHDISDYKLNGGDQEEGPRVAFDWLRSVGETNDVAGAVAEIVRDASFKGAGVVSRTRTLEGMVVQDADRLDAIGAIGVARAFAYGGFSGEPMHDPDLKPKLHETHEDYLNRRSTTINHFHEKLLILKDAMNTSHAKAIAGKRHEFLITFLNQFLTEWDAKDLGI